MKAINHLGSLKNRQFLFVSGKEILEIATTLIMGIYGCEVLLCISSLPVIFFIMDWVILKIMWAEETPQSLMSILPYSSVWRKTKPQRLLCFVHKIFMMKHLFYLVPSSRMKNSWTEIWIEILLDQRENPQGHYVLTSAKARTLKQWNMIQRSKSFEGTTHRHT